MANTQIAVNPDQSQPLNIHTFNTFTIDEKPPKCNIPVNPGKALLIDALWKKETDEVTEKRIDEAGPNINCRRKECQSTPLLLATKIGRSDKIVRKILFAGGRPDVKDKYGNTALTHAIKTRRGYLIKDFLDFGPKNLIAIAEENHPLLPLALQHSADDATIKFLISAGASLSAKGEHNRTSLWFSLYRERQDDVIMALTEPHVDVEASTTTGMLQGYSSLMMAMSDFRSEQVIRKILEAGAMPNLQKFSCPLQQHSRINKTLPSFLRTHKLSPMLAAFGFKNTVLVKMFISLNFLNNMDLVIPKSIKSIVLRYLEEGGDEECLDLAYQTLNNPWSLWTLSFITVSTRLGFNTDRREKLRFTGLPKSLQRQLMFISDE